MKNLFPLAWLALALTACSSPAATENAATSDAATPTETAVAREETSVSSTSTTTTEPATGSLDACALVTEADAQEALGEPVQHIQPERAPAWPQCDYVPKDAAHRAAAMFVQIQAGMKGGRSQFDFDKKMFQGTKPLDGLGDAAFYFHTAADTQLSVIKGSQYFTIVIGMGAAGKEAAQLAAAKKLAAKVLDRL